MFRVPVITHGLCTCLAHSLTLEFFICYRYTLFKKMPRMQFDSLRSRLLLLIISNRRHLLSTFPGALPGLQGKSSSSHSTLACSRVSFSSVWGALSLFFIWLTLHPSEHSSLLMVSKQLLLTPPVWIKSRPVCSCGSPACLYHDTYSTVLKPGVHSSQFPGSLWCLEERNYVFHLDILMSSAP